MTIAAVIDEIKRTFSILCECIYIYIVSKFPSDERTEYTSADI